MFRPSTLERAFELARSGNYTGLGKIRDALQAEGYTLSQLDGAPSLRNQLSRLCADAQKAKNPEREVKPRGRRRATHK
jgi:hypothetical protein